jgi:hypothetical protein
MGKFLTTVFYGDKEVDAKTGDETETLRFLHKYEVRPSKEEIESIKEQKTFKLEKPKGKILVKRTE